MSRLVDALLGFAYDGKLVCGCSERESWNNVRPSMCFTRFLEQNNTARGELFSLPVLRLINELFRFTGPLSRGETQWITVDATSECVSGINLGGQRISLVRPKGFQECSKSFEGGDFRIGYNELEYIPPIASHWAPEWAYRVLLFGSENIISTSRT